MSIRFIGFGLCSLLFWAPAALADAPTIAVQGTLRSAAGLPVVAGKYAFTYSLYVSESAKDPVHQEIHPGIVVTDGIISATLGQKTPLDSSKFTSSDVLWLGVSIDSEPELKRTPLRSVPYAITSLQALGLECTACISGDHLAPELLANKVTTETLTQTLKAYVTNASLQDTLAGYVTSANLGDNLGNYVTAAELGAQLKNYATSAALSTALQDNATKTDLSNALKDNATKTDLSNALKDNADKPYVNQTVSAALADFASNAQLDKYLPKAGGTIAGDLTVKGNLSVTGGTLSARLEILDVKKTPCNAAQHGHIVMNEADSALYYCDSTSWRRVAGCLGNCAAPAAVLCGNQVFDDCSSVCPGVSGTGLNTSQCKSAGNVACGQAIADDCGNVCPDKIGNKCNPGGTCDGKQCTYSSCKAALDANPASNNGTYTIDPDGSGGVEPFSVFCDMVNGGWIRVEETTNFTYTDHGKGNDAVKKIPFIYTLTTAQIDAIRIVSTEAKQAWDCHTVGVNKEANNANWIIWWNGTNSQFPQCQSPNNSSEEQASGTHTDLNQVPAKSWNPYDCGDPSEACQHNVDHAWFK